MCCNLCTDYRFRPWASTYTRNPLSKPVVGTNEWNPWSEVMLEPIVETHRRKPWSGHNGMGVLHMCSGRGLPSWIWIIRFCQCHYSFFWEVASISCSSIPVHCEVLLVWSFFFSLSQGNICLFSFQKAEVGRPEGSIFTASTKW